MINGEINNRIWTVKDIVDFKEDIGNPRKREKTCSKRMEFGKKATQEKLLVIVFIKMANNTRKVILQETSSESNGQVRVVLVKTATGVYRRPASRIIVWETEIQTDADLGPGAQLLETIINFDI